MSNGKVKIVILTAGLIKKISLYKMSYFPELCTLNKNKIKVELDLSNYVTKSDLKNTIGVDTSNFAEKADLDSLISNIDKLDIHETETTLVDLSKLTNVVKNEVVKKMYKMSWLKS